MSEIMLIKTAGGALVPADPQAQEYIAKLKLGAAVKAKVTRQNNPAFHRKMMALINFGFEHWEPGVLTYKGVPVSKHFNQFRKEVTIMAGYYEAVTNFKGEVRLIAKSLAFGSMDQDEREAVYSAIINVLLAKVLKHYTRDKLDEVVERLLRFE